MKGTSGKVSFAPTRTAEPLLTQIKTDRTTMLSPILDTIHFYDLKVVKDLPAAYTFAWALLCLYNILSPSFTSPQILCHQESGY